MECWDGILQKAVYALSQHLTYGTVSPIARIHRSRILEVRKGIVPLIITPSKSLGKCLLPVPLMLTSAGLDVLIPKGACYFHCTGSSVFPHFQFGILMLLNQQGKKGITVLGGLIDADYHGEIGLPLHNGCKKYYVWSAREPLGHLLVLPFPV